MNRWCRVRGTELSEIAGCRAVDIYLARLSSLDHGEWRSLVAHPAGGRAVEDDLERPRLAVGDELHEVLVREYTKLAAAADGD